MYFDVDWLPWVSTEVTQPFHTAMSDLQQIGIKTSDKSEGYGNKCMGTMLENMYVHPSLVHEDEFDKDRCRLVGGNWLP